MADDNYGGCSGCSGESCPSAEDQANAQANALRILVEIVEKYGGTVVRDPDTGVFMIKVPQEHELAVAQDIDKEMGQDVIS